MKLVELKCKNCGANLKVEENAKEVTCNFCNTTFSIETMEKDGYEFEKGRIKAQKEELSSVNLSEAMKTATDALDELRKYQWKKTPLVFKIMTYAIMAFSIGFIIFVFIRMFL